VKLPELFFQADKRAVAACHELIILEYVAAVQAFATSCREAPRTAR
jgi:hypothetical protein